MTSNKLAMVEAIIARFNSNVLRFHGWEATQRINSKEKYMGIIKKTELIHSEIFGANILKSSCKMYILTFIDDSSRKTWVYFLVEKSNALDYFKSFRTGDLICCLRTDKGGEFNSLDLINIVMKMVLKGNSQELTLLNKMEWLKGKTRPY